MSVCESVCLSTRIYPEPRARSLPIFVHVAYVCGSVLLRHVYDRPHRLSVGRGRRKCTARVKRFSFSLKMHYQLGKGDESAQRRQSMLSTIALFFVVVYFFWLVNVCFCCVRFCFFIPSQEIGLQNSPKWLNLCWVGRKTLISVSDFPGGQTLVFRLLRDRGWVCRYCVMKWFGKFLWGLYKKYALFRNNQFISLLYVAPSEAPKPQRQPRERRRQGTTYNTTLTVDNTHTIIF